MEIPHLMISMESGRGASETAAAPERWEEERTGSEDVGATLGEGRKRLRSEGIASCRCSSPLATFRPRVLAAATREKSSTTSSGERDKLLRPHIEGACEGSLHGIGA